MISSENASVVSKKILPSLQWLLCFIVCFFTMNPVFHTLRIRGFILLIVLALLTIVRNHFCLRFSRAHIVAYVVVIVFISTSGVSAIFNGTITPVVFSGFFAISVLVVIQTEDVEVCGMVEAASLIFLFFIMMAAVGVVYYQLGGSPLLTLANPDGRSNNFYLTTFSNSITSFSIRPSAIYDEPGAFSFFICMLVAFRSRLGLPLKGSMLLLLGGLLTQSITHVIFSLLWFGWVLHRRDIDRKAFWHNFFKRFTLALLGGGIVVVVLHVGILDWAIERAVFFYKHPWANPRQNAMENIFHILEMKPDGVWFGFEEACVRRLPDCSGMGENLLTPLIYGGLFASWPYYLFLLIAIFAPFFSRDGLLLFGIALLLLQRPYLLEFPYSALFALGFVVWFIPNVYKRRTQVSTTIPIHRSIL